MPPNPVEFSPLYFIGLGITSLAGIGSLVCLIMVLIPLFKKEGPGLGVLGIFCGIYSYIWGWMNVKTSNLKKIMLAWTACIVLVLLGYAVMFVGIAQMAASNPDAFAPPATAPMSPTEL